MVTKSEPTVMSTDSTVASDALEVFLVATGVMQKRGLENDPSQSRGWFGL